MFSSFFSRSFVLRTFFRHSCFGFFVMDATIVIPQYGRSELTCACVRSIRACERTAWPIVVVDDGSGAADVARVRDAGFDGTVVVTQTHRGVTSAWNRGLAACESRFVVFVNNDVTWTGPAVERLIGPLREERALATGVRWRRERSLPSSILRWLPSGDFLEGWCFAAVRAALDKIGGFDESLAVYFSDTDLQARLMSLWRESRPAVDRRAAHGADVRRGLEVVEELPLHHAGHRTARALPDRRAVWMRDRKTFIEKWEVDRVETCG
jgi:glycosyltransferase involved in cell wall biosynthesis